MNGIHDLGGMHGFGAVTRERDEPVFHAAWERRVFGLFAPAFAAGLFCVDEFRHAIERMGAAAYLSRATTSTGCTPSRRSRSRKARSPPRNCGGACHRQHAAA